MMNDELHRQLEDETKGGKHREARIKKDSWK